MSSAGKWLEPDKVHCVKWNKPDSERQLTYFLSHAESTFFLKTMKVEGGVFGKRKGTEGVEGATREGNLERWIWSKYVICMYENIIIN
jgi:hypothetical protein